ncbi:hypothetical protein CF335_g2631 [Tilletia laevis]|nr:hypothetical protein CF335_g2631 [Tilletia laevis]
MRYIEDEHDRPDPRRGMYSTNGQDQIGRRSNIHLLLGLKKRGFGLGHINAFGGKPILLSTSPPLDDDHVIESPLDCALREFAEETSIELDQHVVSSTLKAHGRLLIHASHPSASVEDKFANELSLLYIFSLPLDHDQLVAAKETDEMCPHIYPLNNLPFQDMHPESSLLIDLIFGPRNAHHQQLPSPAYFFDARIDYQGVTDAMSSGEQGRASQATAVRTCRRRIARRWSVNFYDSPPAQ